MDELLNVLTNRKVTFLLQAIICSLQTFVITRPGQVEPRGMIHAGKAVSGVHLAFCLCVVAVFMN